jgi:hypothetical protein
MAGFDARNATCEGQCSVVGIHHPAGDVKKISFFHGNLTMSCYYGMCRKPNHWKVEPWTLGTTEPGSSGSALFSDRHQVIGQLHGGSASCMNPKGRDLYGALSVSWNAEPFEGVKLSEILDPAGDGELRYVEGAELNVLRHKLSVQF